MRVPKQQFAAIPWRRCSFDKDQKIVPVRMDLPSQAAPPLLLAKLNEEVSQTALAKLSAGGFSTHRIDAWRLNEPLQRFYGVEQHGGSTREGDGMRENRIGIVADSSLRQPAGVDAVDLIDQAAVFLSDLRTGRFSDQWNPLEPETHP
jgi:hypothetical protein